ncbi:MAG: hypothetical protein AB8B59_12730 [Maribacter sp.]
MGCRAQKSITPTKENVQIVNRELSFTGESLELDAAEGSGMVILNDVSFRTGTMQLDIKGENNPGRSFVGIAFNIQNDSTYEAIYFRPFNFESSEQIRREHGIQYIYTPDFDWRRLRTENEGEFEAEFINPPSPDEWFSILVTVENDKVIVKEADSGKLLMQTRRLSAASSEKFGFWVGNNSRGSFKNLRIQQD